MNRDDINEQTPRGPVDLLEDAVALLRTAPPGALASYAVGALPAILAAVWFTARLTSGAAPENPVGLAGILALAVVWKAFWTAVFTDRLNAALGGFPPPRWTVGRIARVFRLQAAVQPWGMVLLPAAAALVFPFPRAVAFFCSATAVAPDDDLRSTRQLRSAAGKLAAAESGQNWGVVALLFLLGPIVWFNILIVFSLVPYLMKALLGIDTVLSRGGFTLLDMSFLTASAGITYLVLDPLVKAAYTLRCFSVRSRSTGEDLLAECRTIARPNTAAGTGTRIALLMAAALFFAAPAGAAAPGTAPPDNDRVQRLDRSIRETMSRDKYTWRKPGAPNEGDDRLSAALRDFAEWVRDLLTVEPEEEGEPEPVTPPRPAAGTGAWSGNLTSILYVLLAITAAGLLATIVYVILAGRKKDGDSDDDAASAVGLDLAEDEVNPGDLSEEQWLEKARDMMRRGDRRTALRAMYLSCLSLLGSAGLLNLARSKSNREYRGELRRRGPDTARLADLFDSNVGFFEDTWYGTRAVTDEVADSFISNQDRIRNSLDVDRG